MGRLLILFIVDTLRHDIVANEQLVSCAAPNLHRLMQQGSLGRIVANASNTQFVMPTLLTGTYPLDHGGYNKGCKKRPDGLVPIARAAGFHSSLLTNCVLYDRDLDFDRGFDVSVVPVNTRRSLTQDLEYTILPVLRKWQSGELTNDQAIQFLQTEYRSTVENLKRICGESERQPLKFGVLADRQRDLLRRSEAELRLIDQNPLSLARKLLAVPEAFYWAALGRASAGVGPLGARLRNRLSNLFGRISVPKKYPTALFDGIDLLVEELEEDLLGLLKRPLDDPEQDRLAVFHLMDVHTPPMLANQYRRCPAIVRERERCADRLSSETDFPKPLYLAALHAVDKVIGRIVADLKDRGLWDQTGFFVTADHGTTIPMWDDMPIPDLPNRFEIQDLAVPVIAAGGLAPTLPSRNELFDSRDLGATILHAAGITPPDGFQGKPMIEGNGREAVVSENGGRGHLDIANDDLNFAVTGADCRLLARLSGDKLDVVRRWHGKSSDEGSDKDLLKVLFQERGEILSARGAA